MILGDLNSEDFGWFSNELIKWVSIEAFHDYTTAIKAPRCPHKGRGSWKPSKHLWSLLWDVFNIVQPALWNHAGLQCGLYLSLRPANKKVSAPYIKLAVQPWKWSSGQAYSRFTYYPGDHACANEAWFPEIFAFEEWVILIEPCAMTKRHS